ncbi:MAG: hypothetical protein Q7U07_07115 [Gammaproteobacteria bacterium]|nr:hypothetical protein [Gammaproteobacteria bacterium]
MKRLFLLLVLLNLGFFAWQLVGDNTDAAAPITTDKAKGIVLLRELNTAQLKQLSPAAEPPSVPESLPPATPPATP